MHSGESRMTVEAGQMSTKNPIVNSKLNNAPSQVGNNHKATLLSDSHTEEEQYRYASCATDPQNPSRQLPEQAASSQLEKSPRILIKTSLSIHTDKSLRNNRCYLSTTVGLISQNNLHMVTAVTMDMKSRCQQLFITKKIMKAKG